KWGNVRVAIEVIIVEVPCVEYRVPDVPEHRTVIVIGTVLGLDINLSAGLRAVFHVVQGTADLIFLDRILRNLQAGLGFLGLLLNAAGVDAIEREIVIVASPSGKADGALITATVILSEWSKECEAGPVPPVIGQFRDLISVDNGGSFGR